MLLSVADIIVAMFTVVVMVPYKAASHAAGGPSPESGELDL